MATETAGAPADRYELRDLVGRGSFGAVHRGYDQVAQREVAIKVIDLEDIEEDIGEIQREIAALKECQSPAITQYYGSAVVPGTSQLMIVMELMAASAGDVVGEDTGGEPLPEPCIAYILRQVLHALVYLHGQGRIHRDIKAANILLAEDGRVKVSDFGVSAQLSGTVGYKRRTFVGSPLWMAPEVIEQSPDNIGFRKDGSGDAADGYDAAADIWSLGITAMELAQGEPPRVNVASFRLLFMIVRDDPPQLEGSEFSTDFKDFVWQCLRKDPADRPTAADLLEHPFVAAAESAPAELAQRVAAYLQRRPALLEKAAQRASLAGGYGTVGATLPRWDFAGPAGGAAAGLGAAAGTVVARPVTAPSPADGSGMLRTGAGPVGEEFGTVVRRHTDSTPSPNAAAAAAAAAEFGGTMQVRPGGSGLAGVAPPSRLVIPSDPTQPDWPATATASYAARPGSAAGPACGTAAVNGSASKQLLQTGLSACAAAPGATPAVAAAAETAVAALGQLEAARPGAVAEALTEMLTQLSLTSSPALASLKGSAAALFCGSEAAAAGGQAAAGDVPDLGPLGRFLMQRWREATARERVAHAQQWQAS